MGLDNGLTLITKKEVNEPLPFDVEGRFHPYFDGNEYEYNLCHWRKCDNIRDCIRETFYRPSDDVSMDNMCIDDVKQVWHIINTLNKKKRWEQDDSFWSYKEVRDMLDYDLLCIEWLIHYMRHHNDDEYRVVFYDSY